MDPLMRGCGKISFLPHEGLEIIVKIIKTIMSNRVDSRSVVIDLQIFPSIKPLMIHPSETFLPEKWGPKYPTDILTLKISTPQCSHYVSFHRYFTMLTFISICLTVIIRCLTVEYFTVVNCFYTSLTVISQCFSVIYTKQLFHHV